MTIKQAIEILKEHQKWRIGMRSSPTCTSAELTQAINTILKHHDNEKNN